MQFLSWLSIVALLASVATYCYWSLREERARPAWIHASFYGGIGLFFALFLAFSWNSVSAISSQSHAEAITADVEAGKLVWQKDVCIECHTMLGNGSYYGPDLTKAWGRFKQRAGGDEQAARAMLVTFLQNPPQPTATMRGMFNYHMPKAEALQLAAFLQWTGAIDTNGWPPPPAYPIVAPTQVASAGSAPEDARGRRLMEQDGCMACHSLGGGRVVGPDLSSVAGKYDRAALLRWMQDPALEYKELRHRPANADYPEMPALHIASADSEAIAAYLLTLDKKGGKR